MLGDFQVLLLIFLVDEPKEFFLPLLTEFIAFLYFPSALISGSQINKETGLCEGAHIRE
jgi:hypothetical protein